MQASPQKADSHSSAFLKIEITNGPSPDTIQFSPYTYHTLLKIIFNIILIS